MAVQALSCFILIIALASFASAFGGGWSSQASLAEPLIVDATVIYDGLLQSEPKALKKLKGPALGIFAR